MLVTGVNRATVGVYKYPELIKATPSVFNKVSLVTDKKRRGDIDCRYTFTFEIKSEIPNDGTL